MVRPFYQSSEDCGSIHFWGSKIVLLRIKLDERPYIVNKHFFERTPWLMNIHKQLNVRTHAENRAPLHENEYVFGQDFFYYAWFTTLALRGLHPHT